MTESTSSTASPIAIQGTKVEITVFWLVGVVVAAIGFGLAIVSLTLPWTFVSPLPGQDIQPGAPTQPFLTRITDYEPMSILTALLVIGFGVVVVACFSTAGIPNVIVRVVAVTIGLVMAWGTALIYLVLIRTMSYGYARDVGESFRFTRKIYSIKPGVGLLVYVVGALLMTAGAVLAIRPTSYRPRPTATVPVPVSVRRVANVCTAGAVVLALGSFLRPWMRPPADPLSDDLTWGTPPDLSPWVLAFRFTLVAALVLLTAATVSKSVRHRGWLKGSGLVACCVTLTILLASRAFAWLPGIVVEVRYTYYLAVGAAVLLSIPFLISAVAQLFAEALPSEEDV